MSDPFGGVNPSADAGNPETKVIYGAIITVTIFATIAVIFRFVARKKSKASLSYDDYSIVLALVFLYGLNIGTIIATALWGLGRHFFTLSEDQLLHFQKNGLANFTLYFTTNATIKISLLLLYYRLFSPSRRFRIAVYTTAVIVVAWWIAVFFADIFQCVPINAFWNYNVKNLKKARCMSTVTFSIGTGVSNLVTDLMVLCLPIPMVWSLRTNRRQKITLTGIFLLGFFVCAISIIRIVKLVSPGHFDPTYSLAQVFIWTCVEPSVGVISACLPSMRPLFGRWLIATVPSRSKPNKSPSAKKTNSSSKPADSADLASPVKGRFTRLDGPTYRDHFEAAYRNDKSLETTTTKTSSGERDESVLGDSSRGKNMGSYYGDKKGPSWYMYGPSDKGDSRLGEGRGVDGEEEGVQMQEWPGRRDGGGWRTGLG